MTVKEFKIHLMRGVMRPEYFYIPIIYNKEIVPVRFKLSDEYGDDVYATRISLYYNTYSLFHDLYRDESGQWISDHDSGYKGYAFSTDYEWRFPVPNPSAFEIYPIPDFTNAGITATDGEIQISGTGVTVVFNEPQTLIEIKDLPAGVYSVSLSTAYVTDENGNSLSLSGVNYYPDYYSGEYSDTEHPLYSGNSYGMVDRSGGFSGFYMYQLSGQYGQPTGYNFYGISKKFENNAMPVVVNYSTHTMELNKTDEFGRRVAGIKFRLYSDSGGFDSEYPYILFATVVSRSENDVVFTTKSSSIRLSKLLVDRNYELTEIEAENYQMIQGTISFHYTKTGECVCTTPQSEYIKYSDSTLTIANKKLNRRLKMVITLIDPPEGEIVWTYRYAQPMSYTLHNPSGYWGQYFQPVPPATIDDLSSNTEYGGTAFIRNSIWIGGSYVKDESIDVVCNKMFLAKFYLDDEYKGSYTQYRRTYSTIPYEYTEHTIVGYDGENNKYIGDPEIIDDPLDDITVEEENVGYSCPFGSYGDGTDPYLYYRDSGIRVYATTDPEDTSAPIYNKLWKKSVGSHGHMDFGVGDDRCHYLITDGVSSTSKHIYSDPVYGESYSEGSEKKYVYKSFELNYSGGTSATVHPDADFYYTKDGVTRKTENIGMDASFSLTDIKAYLAKKESGTIICDVPYTETSESGLVTTYYNYMGEGLTVADIDEFISIAKTEDMDVILEI